MVFSSVIFVFFFLPVVIIGYYLLPKIARNYFLLAASLFFYAWGEPKAVWVMVLSIVCNYVLGLLVGRTHSHQAGSELPGNNGGNSREKSDLQAENPLSGKEDRSEKNKGFLVLAVIVNIGILFIYKYLGFVTENLNAVFSQVPVLQIALPIGISFYTFQGLSYVIDVYRGQKPLKNPFTLALYISMFPQLIAGPIVRYGDIAEQLKNRIYDSERFAQGIRRFAAGLAKKVILANQMGALADLIFEGDYSVMSTGVAWLGTLAYTLQIFFDFSGYSDMAIGLGKMLGFTFAENFDRPYLSTSVSEFWRRWHMSLSGWFRDYVYIPLGGSRKGNVYLHLMIVFLLTGIWHGAGWGFLIWGLWHGCFVVAERYVGKRIKGQNKNAEQGVRKSSAPRAILGWFYTILVVMMGWTLFRIVDFPAFAKYASVMLGFGQGEFTAFGLRYYLTNQRIFYLVLAILACVPVGRIIDRLFKAKMIGNINTTDARNPGDQSAGTNSTDGLELEPMQEKHCQDRHNHSTNTAGMLLADWGMNLAALALLVICYIYMINSTYNPFIYFRF
ncbi:MAG: MBOAT family protein [Lachnospiraceae bacterium]|nr:MBOAT family protein [Lachnospiraceae bacterium]